MEITRIEELRLSKDVEAEISALIEASFSVSFEGRSFFQNRHHCRFLVRQDKELVGHLAVAYRAIRLGTMQVDIVGLAEVVVAADYRNRGIGSALVSAAIKEGRTAGAEFAALFGNKNIYGRSGFVNVPNKLIINEMEGVKTGSVIQANDPHFMIKQLGDTPWDTDVIVDLAGFAF